MPDRDLCWTTTLMEVRVYRKSSTHVVVPRVLGLEGKTPKKASLIQVEMRDGWINTAAVLNFPFVSSYQR